MNVFSKEEIERRISVAEMIIAKEDLVFKNRHPYARKALIAAGVIACGGLILAAGYELSIVPRMYAYMRWGNYLKWALCGLKGASLYGLIAGAPAAFYAARKNGIEKLKAEWNATDETELYGFLDEHK